MFYALEIPRQNVLRGPKFEESFRNLYTDIGDSISHVKIARLDLIYKTFYVMVDIQNPNGKAYITTTPRAQFQNKSYYNNAQLLSIKTLHQIFTLRCGVIVKLNEQAIPAYKILRELIKHESLLKHKAITPQSRQRKY